MRMLLDYGSSSKWLWNLTRLVSGVNCGIFHRWFINVLGLLLVVVILYCFRIFILWILLLLLCFTLVVVHFFISYLVIDNTAAIVTWNFLIIRGGCCKAINSWPSARFCVIMWGKWIGLLHGLMEYVRVLEIGGGFMRHCEIFLLKAIFSA